MGPGRVRGEIVVFCAMISDTSLLHYCPLKYKYIYMMFISNPLFVAKLSFARRVLVWLWSHS